MAESYLARRLPSGNHGQRAWLVECVQRAGIRGAMLAVSASDFAIAVPATQAQKLPVDHQGFYLGDEREGFSLYEISSLGEIDIDAEWIEIGATDAGGQGLTSASRNAASRASTVVDLSTARTKPGNPESATALKKILDHAKKLPW